MRSETAKLGILQPGDILLNDTHHVCMVISGYGHNAIIAQASIDERGRLPGARRAIRPAMRPTSAVSMATGTVGTASSATAALQGGQALAQAERAELWSMAGGALQRPLPCNRPLELRETESCPHNTLATVAS